MSGVCLYKFLRRDGTSPFFGYAWPLPRGRRPGRWVDARGAPIIGMNGFHMLTRAGLTKHPGPRLYTAQVDGVQDRNLTCVSAQRARLLRRVESWNERTLVSWLTDCVEHAANHPTSVYGDEHPSYKQAIASARAVIAAARAWVRGEASESAVVASYYPTDTWSPINLSVRHLVDVVACPDDFKAAVMSAEYAKVVGASRLQSIIEYRRTADVEAKWQWRRMLRYLGEGNP